MMKAYPKYKDSEVLWCREVPQHWESHKAKFLFKKMSRPVCNGDDVVTCFRDGTVTLRKNRRTKGFTESIKETGYQGIRRGDLVIHQMDAFAGAAGISDSHGKGTPVYSVCFPRRELEPKYFAHLVREMARSEYISSLAKGIRERSTDFRFDTFGAQLLPFPPLNEQRQISRYLDWQTSKINKFIKAKKKLIALLKEQRQNIINEAVTKGINPNVKMKDSGVEWLGEIPEHWNTVSVKRIVKSIQTGPFGSQLHAHDYVDNGMPLINPKHIKNGTIVPDPSCSIDSENHQRLIKYSLQKSDLIMARRGELGRCAIVSEKENGWLCGTGSLFLRLKRHNFIDKYFYFIMSSRVISKVLSLSSVGATMDNLNGTIVGNLMVPFVPLSEQQTILEHIEKETSLIDKTISRAEREIELIQEYRTRLISDVVTGKIDVRSIEIPDFEPIEADWEVPDEEESENEPIAEGIEE